jgi:ethanolamine permease
MVAYVLIPFALIRFRKMFPQHSSKVRPFIGPMQPWIAYFTIFLAMIILSTLNWGYRYNLIFGLVFYIVAYFYFNWRYKSIESEHDWERDMGWPQPVMHRSE